MIEGPDRDGLLSPGDAVVEYTQRRATSSRCQRRSVAGFTKTTATGRSQGIVLSFLYWSLRRLLELVVLRFRSHRRSGRPAGDRRRFVSWLCGLLGRTRPRALTLPVKRETHPTSRFHRATAAFSRVLPRKAPTTPDPPASIADEQLDAGGSTVWVPKTRSNSASWWRRRRISISFSDVGIPADPGRVGRARDQARREHGLDDPA
jgi:hypothetical protein